MNMKDIEFIISHFQDQIELFPRKMMTSSKPWQFSISSKEQIYRECNESEFKDCRINAYAEYTNYRGIIRQPPNFIFIDLDLANFAMDRNKMEFGLKKTLRKIEGYNGFPTVLWTGNGYHIYLPIKAIVLDQESIFSKEKFSYLFSAIGKYHDYSVSKVFLKFAEIFFTNGKADPLHKPKYTTCLIRIPATYNLKNIRSGKSKEQSLIKIVQKWDGKSIPIQSLLRKFRAWITQEEINQKLTYNERKIFQQTKLSTASFDNIDWIEKLLQNSLGDNRKYCLFRILAPYLINMRKLSPEESSIILKTWLSKCDQIRPLAFKPTIEIRKCIKYVKEYRALGAQKLREHNPELYSELKSKNIL